MLWMCISILISLVKSPFQVVVLFLLPLADEQCMPVHGLKFQDLPMWIFFLNRLYCNWFSGFFVHRVDISLLFMVVLKSVVCMVLICTCVFWVCESLNEQSNSSELNFCHSLFWVCLYHVWFHLPVLIRGWLWCPLQSTPFYVLCLTCYIVFACNERSFLLNVRVVGCLLIFYCVSCGMWAFVLNGICTRVLLWIW